MADVTRLVRTVAVTSALLGVPTTAFAQWMAPPPSPNAWGAPPTFVPAPVKPLPPPTVSDWGWSQSANARFGYTSGLRIGASLSAAVRWTTWPYRTAFGADAMELSAFTNVADGEVGWRLSPFNFLFPLWSDSVFQSGYVRWNFIEFGSAYRPNGHSSLEVGSAVSFGYSYEVSDAIAWRVGELGIFGGVFAVDRGAPEPAVLFDGGLTLTTGLIFR